MSRDPCDRLDDLIERIDAATRAERLLEQAEASNDQELASTLTDAILYDLVIIGEAIKSLPGEFKSHQGHVPWSLASKLRDRLAHHYFDVDLAVIRQTLDEPFATLRCACSELKHHFCSP